MPTKNRIQCYVDPEISQRLNELWEEDKEKSGFAVSFSEWLEKKIKEWLEDEK